MGGKLYIRKIVFNYKKEVRIWKRISSMRRQLAKDWGWKQRHAKPKKKTQFCRDYGWGGVTWLLQDYFFVFFVFLVLGYMVATGFVFFFFLHFLFLGRESPGCYRLLFVDLLLFWFRLQEPHILHTLKNLKNLKNPMFFKGVFKNLYKNQGKYIFSKQKMKRKNKFHFWKMCVFTVFYHTKQL